MGDVVDLPGSKKPPAPEEAEAETVQESIGLLCRLGLHSWSGWCSPYLTCFQMEQWRKCINCGIYKTRRVGAAATDLEEEDC